MEKVKMRLESWNTLAVYYEYFDKNSNSVRNGRNGIQCYSSLRNIPINPECKLVLLRFNKEETSEYAKEYITRLSKIFDLKIIWINDDEIEVTGFRSNLYLNTFVCIFRYLFENGTGKGVKNVKMISNFVKDDRDEDMLWKFIDSFNKAEFNMGNTNHSISSDHDSKLQYKTIEELVEYDKNPKLHGYAPIHNFFKVEEKVKVAITIEEDDEW
ncbi:MAG TPA: hypothetical protein VF680_17125 [Allosphingosinicella sp.]|jgi:hypothetical protein